MRRRWPNLARLGAVSRPRRLGAVALAAVLLTAAATGVGFAASLVVDPNGLTSSSGAVSVPTTTCTLTAVADTYADENSPGSNFGTQTTFNVDARTSRNRRAFARFDLASCAIPSVADVRSAGLQLFMSTAPAASRTHDVHRVTQAWGETTLNWTTQPTTAATATASVATGTASNVTLEWNVLSDVAAFVAGAATNEGWRIKDQTEVGGANREAIFSAREHATATERPKLVITYYP